MDQPKKKINRGVNNGKRGAPTKFRPEMCELLIEHMSKGLSYESFGATLTPRIGRATLYHWESTHPEWKQAKDVGQTAMELFLERIGIAGMTGQLKNFNATVWIFQRKNKSGWRDSVEQIISSDDVNVEGFTFLEPKKENG